MSSSERLRVAVLISGSGTNLQAIIDAQQSGELNIDIVAVLSDRPDAYGLTRAIDAGLHALAINYRSFASREDYDAELRNALDHVRPDLIVLAGYMRILPDETVNEWAGRMLNVHPSLLPAYPGLDTYKRALDAGESHHGTTVHLVIPELDAGPPILQYRVAVRTHDTEDTLRDRVQQGEYVIYPQVIGWIADGRLQFEKGWPVLDGKPLERPVVMDEVVEA
jgi:phosphoribosylglycinamide formyltransferase-1